MSRMKHVAMGFVMFGIVIGLLTVISNNFTSAYDLDEGNLDDQGNTIGEALANLNFITGVQRLYKGILDVIQPANLLDVVGGLASVGTGILQTLGGLVTWPVEIFGIMFGSDTSSGFYQNIIPPVLNQGIAVLAGAFMAFIILSAFLRRDV